MSNLARICVVLILTLGFPIHDVMARGAIPSSGTCPPIVDAAADEESGQALPDKPSCKIIGAGSHGTAQRVEWTVAPARFIEVQDEASVWRPGGPEKPPKRA